MVLCVSDRAVYTAFSTTFFGLLFFYATPDLPPPHGTGLTVSCCPAGSQVTALSGPCCAMELLLDLFEQ